MLGGNTPYKVQHVTGGPEEPRILGRDGVYLLLKEGQVFQFISEETAKNTDALIV